ncbi:ArsR family transcriptional regulator [Corallococcus praedator]|uniref:ArsR family transcriptional regulator n=1 Tax=Corallococcus praedator TaxID=2316724 RepID=A0ABX9QEL2_9BACT|nr:MULTISPECIES: helix-turn-helix domain-containing protein [Corallococcus]MCY1041123.1 helix-turn-helix domain-containing protein [Corallococcus sp. bb12-1]RKH09951.1 ArsR family transcriptional regulator [Corallococcus sp. CA047B]RKH28163.1 ArsR family transcriptional regulator [Corallococcus sp. CA031C]RKI05892.1 ArsR family transcriptional regulator [Corallococcus praedator]
MSSSTRDDLIFKALADSRRRAILDLLKDAPRTTGELCEHFASTLDRCTVMQHIGVLERAELILVRREGRTRWNHLNAAPFQEIHERWISPYAAHAVALLSKLKRDLEGE